MKTVNKEIRVSIVYNAFDLSKIERSELVYRKNTMLKTYLKGLPDTCEWRIGLNGNPVELETHGHLRLSPKDTIQLVVVPAKGDGAKSVLRVVAQIGIAVGAAVAFAALSASGFGIIGAAAVAAAISVGGNLLVNAVLPIKTPKADKDDGNSYGYDGAKNTVREGVALPVVYGEYRVAGNYVDLYTENVGDDQYIYGRTVLSDGKIASVTLPELNDQPIENYTNVDWDFRLGSPNETINPYFNRNVKQIAKSIKLNGAGAWVTHTTIDPVDKIQLNLQFPRGLVHLTDKGKKQNRTATVEVQMSEKGQNNWRALGSSRVFNINGDPGATYTPSTSKLYVTVDPNAATTDVGAPYNYTIEYRRQGETNWTVFKTVAGTIAAQAYYYDNELNFGGINTGLPTYYNVSNDASYEWNVPTGEYQIRVTGGSITSYGYSVNVSGQATYAFTDNRAKTIRKTIESGNLALGEYDIRIRKVNADGDNEYDVDELYLIDVGEITTTGIAMNNIANAYYRVKMTEQLNGVPSITWLVRGVEVNKYDINGNVTAKEWSDNPAWIVLDMLIGGERGSINIYSIDFPMFVEWAAWCETAGLKFNGVFDSTTTLWDACVDVLKVGHAAFSRIGTKLSLAIDRPQSPVMLFGPGNIFKNTFKVSYLPLSGRANEFEMAYFDKTDGNKQKNIRIVDPDADIQGQLPRPVSYSVRGIDNFDQAQREVWYQLYNNRYLRRTVSFDAPVESIGLGIGDVAFVQHDMMNWGLAGRVDTGSTVNSLVADKKIIFDGSDPHAVSVIHDKLIRATGTAVSVMSNTVTVSGVTDTTISLANVKRIYQPNSGLDREIIGISFAGTTAYVQFSGNATFTNSQIQFIDTDVIEERDVASITGDYVINVTAPFSQAPAKYSNYMFGIKTIVKKPYRLKSMSGTGFDRRNLTFTEYNPAIYNPPEMIVPFPPTSKPKGVSHVTNLLYSYDLRSTEANSNVSGVLSWTVEDSTNYGGADIYVALNGSDFIFSRTVLNTTEAQLNFNFGDEGYIKVVAFNTTLVRAPVNTAPYTTLTIQSGPTRLDPPRNLSVTLISYLALGLVEATWDAPLTALDTPVRYRVQMKLDGKTSWDEYGVTSETSLRMGDLPAGNHTARIRTERVEAVSNYVEQTFAVGTTAQTIEPGSTVGGTIGSNIKNPDGSIYQPGAPGGGSSDFTPPSVPTGLAVNSAVSDRGAAMTITWNVPSDPDLAGYKVEIAEGSGTYIGYVTSTPNYKIEVSRNTAYRVRVSAYDRAGNASAFSNVVNHTTAKDTIPPAKPVISAVTVAYNSATVRWTNGSEPDLSYIKVVLYTFNGIVLDTVFVPAVIGGSGSYIWTNLAKGTTYNVSLETFDTSGNGSGFTALQPFTTAAGVDLNDFTPGLTPPRTVTALPNPSGYVGTPLVYNQTDGKNYRYYNGAWTASVDGFDILTGTFNANKIMAGTITAAQIATDALTARVLAIGNPDNIIPDSDFRDPTFWNSYTPDGRLTVGDVNFSQFLRALTITPSGGIDVFSAYFPVEPGATYKITMAVDTASDFNGQFEPYLHMPGQAWFSLKGGYAEPSPGAGSAGSTFKTSVSETFVTFATFDNALNGRNAQIRLIGGFTGSVRFAVKMVRVSDTTLIKDGAITTDKITVGTLNGDRIMVGTLDASKIKADSVLAGTITVSGKTLATIAAEAGAAGGDPVPRINAGTTQIDPGRILISGGTSLSSWLYGADNSLINGGYIGANTIAANKLYIGSRGLSFQDITFQYNPANGYAAWTPGAIFYQRDDGNRTYVAIAGGQCPPPPPGVYYYIYWIKDEASLRYSVEFSDAIGPNAVHIATHNGSRNITQLYGGTIIDGTNITTGTITADRLNVGTLSAITANLGLMRTASSGQRTEIDSNGMRVYDSNNVLRVRIGNY